MTAAGPGAAPPEPGAGAAAATAGGAFGLYPAAEFVVTDGRHAGGATIRQALWYFRDETIAVPRPGRCVAGFEPGIATFDEIRAWAETRPRGAAADFPPLVWIGAPQLRRGVMLSPDAAALVAGNVALPCRLTPKIPLNRSYFDASSARWLAHHRLSVRGRTDDDGTFVVRTLWPEDFRLDATAPVRTLPGDQSPAAALRALMREGAHGGATDPFATSTLWRRPGNADWTGRPVLAFVVNGAQGDDDEAHAGHFGIVTGRMGADGAIGDWLVDNFYALDSESEKGIVAAPVTLDNYLGDVNSGQAWYRPSCLLVAVLRDERAAALVQSALGRVYNQFYRHQLAYYHPMVNCTSISVDTLRALGWAVPSRGPTGRVLAALGLPWLVVRERSLAKAQRSYDYLTEDLTRLLPAVAVEEIFGSLLGLAGTADSVGTDTLPEGTLARMLAEDLDALAFVRVPQFPSSRAWGGAPVVTLAEYQSRLPRDPAKLQIVPVPPRPFPDQFRDPDLLPPPLRRSDRAVAIWGSLLIVGIPWLVWRAWRRWRDRRRGRAISV